MRTAERPGLLMLLHVLAARRDFSWGGGIAFVVGFLVCSVLAWYFSKPERLKRRLGRAPLRRISAVHPGEQVRVIGTARAQGEPLMAPLTGRPCLYYLAKLEAKRGKEWKTIIHAARGVPFLVDDGSGLALVDPRRADVVLDTDAYSRSGAYDGANSSEARFLARHGMQVTRLPSGSSLCYSEAILEVGERVAVLGTPRHEPDLCAGAPVELRGPLEGRLVICASPDATRT